MAIYDSDYNVRLSENRSLWVVNCDVWLQMQSMHLQLRVVPEKEKYAGF